MMKRLTKKFFARDAKKVARELLGKIILRKNKNKILKGIIVETEAYYDEKDPASRACKKGDLRDTMLMEPGTILVYGVHNNWLFNIVTGKKGDAQAVLIRAVRPINFIGKCSGPGLFTRVFQIDKSFHKKNISECKEIQILNTNLKTRIFSSKRIGVKKDLPQNLRFFIKI